MESFIDHPVLSLIFVLAIVALISSIRIADQYNRAVVLRFGRYVGTRGPGLYFLIPYGIERAIKTDLRVTTWTLPQQETMTSDNVPARITAVLWTKIVDSEKASLVVDDVEAAIRNLAATTMRTVVGSHSLNDILASTESISKALADKIEEAATTWGVDVERVEIIDVDIPESMQRAIAQKAEASREREARIIKADAEYEAARKLSDAAEIISRNPQALELRRLQTLTEIGAEQNTTIVLMIPSEFVQAAKAFSDLNQPR